MSIKLTTFFQKIRRRLVKRFKPSARKHLFKKPLFWFVCLLLGLMVAGGYYAYRTIFNDLPSPAKLSGQTFPVSTQIYDRHQRLLYEIYADTNRTPVSLKDLPEFILQATIAIEDQDFYTHFGFSLQGIVRAIKNTLFNNKLQGGSTITQQLVKTALLQNPERTLKRKLREAVLTVGTEIIYTKDQILEMYLNHIPYGGTAYGIEAAAEKYFNKAAKDLNLAETTLLVGLPQAPTRYSPFTNPDNAKARQYEVLRRMVEDGYITQAVADQAFATPLKYITPTTDIRAPHFVFYIKDLLVDKYGLEKVEKGGLRVTTTLDLDLQNYVQSSVSAEVKSLETFRVSNGAALVTKPDTGEILAMIGSKDYFNTSEDGQVNLTVRLRQPGSSIKPINYVTALQLKKLTPSSIFLDVPTCFNVTGQAAYCPKNYDGNYHGVVQLRYALANSYNIPAVKVLAINSLESMIATASAMGITTFTDPSRYGLSLTLGGGEVTMIDMVTAFGTLANEGVKVTLNPFLKISDYTGKTYEEYHPELTHENLQTFFNPDNPQSNLLHVTSNGLTRVLNREPAYLISHILMDNGARTAAFGASSALVIKGKKVSVKTGTTNDLKDNWTIGYTPQYVVAAWVGNNDNTPMNPRLVSGITGAAPIWNDIMTHLLKDTESLTPVEPPGIKSITVCSLSGTYATEGVPCDGRLEYFWDQSLPKTTTVERKNIWVYKDSGLPAYTGDPLPTPPDPNNLELKDHLVASDLFTTDYCLDCAYPVDDKGRPQRPGTKVNMSTFIPPPPLP